MFQPKFDSFTAGQPLLPDTVGVARLGIREEFRVPRHAAAVKGSTVLPGGSRLIDTKKGSDGGQFEAFDPDRPLLAGVHSITIAQALVCEQLLVELLNDPTAEESGAALLAAIDLRYVRNVHLEADRVRFTAIPADEEAMAERINWMWHAGSCSHDKDIASRAAEAIDVMTSQVAPRGEFDVELLAADLFRLAGIYPAIVTALFAGDLDAVADLIDTAVQNGAKESELVDVARWMFVCWGALEQQLEACLGWRLIHRPLDDAWGLGGNGPYTLGQTFREQIERHEFAHRMRKLYSDNIRNGVDEITDGRTINAIKADLRKFGLGGFNAANEKAIIAAFGQERLVGIPELLSRFGSGADAYHRRYRALLAGPDGKSRAGQHADMLSAPITAVHRTAIVCARTCHIALLATKAKSTDDLRTMLNTHLPEVLRPCSGKRQKDLGKFRLRQLFHVVRIEFLRDGEHRPKDLKGVADPEEVLPLEFDEQDNRRGRKLLDKCWAELNNQPDDWRFITPFGWQCHGLPRVRLSARI